jgi:hypothetical protein
MRHDRGSAVVAASLTLPIVAAAFVLVADVAGLAYAHQNLVHAAAAGARAGAVSSAPDQVAEAKVRDVLQATGGVGARPTVVTTRVNVSGVAMLRVDVIAVVSLPGGVTRTIRASSLSVFESAP